MGCACIIGLSVLAKFVIIFKEKTNEQNTNAYTFPNWDNVPNVILQKKSISVTKNL